MKIVKVALIQRHANKSTKNTSNQYDPLCWISVCRSMDDTRVDMEKSML
jgi:hypothetical protein